MKRKVYYVVYETWKKYQLMFRPWILDLPFQMFLKSA
jgi:hypothetical protein